VYVGAPISSNTALKNNCPVIAGMPLESAAHSACQGSPAKSNEPATIHAITSAGKQ
jgi:hypothetical protein